MSANNAARRQDDDGAFSENSHFPEPTVGAPTSFFDDPIEPPGDGSSQAFLVWLKSCTHTAETLLPKDEIAARVVSLVYLLEGGSKSIGQMALESKVPHSKLHRRIKLISQRTGLRIPHRKKAASCGGAS